MDHLRIGSKIVLLVCLFIHSYIDRSSIIMLKLYGKNNLIKMNYLFEVIYLSHRILGWISDIQILRYRMIKTITHPEFFE